MTGAEPSPYDPPIFRCSHRATSPDGTKTAWMAQTIEQSMGNPRLGILETSERLSLPRCNPAFLWSDCSRYLAVPQFGRRLGIFFAVRMLIVDFDARIVWRAQPVRVWLQPESFENGMLVASRHFRQRGTRIAWQLPLCFDGMARRPF